MDDIKAEIAALRADMGVMINYMREVGIILGARDRLQKLDEKLQEIQERMTGDES